MVKIIKGITKDDYILSMLELLGEQHSIYYEDVQKRLEKKRKEKKVKYSDTLLKVADKYKLDAKELNERSDGRIEWICKHGVGHTLYPEWNATHGCDGCCIEILQKNVKKN